LSWRDRSKGWAGDCRWSWFGGQGIFVLVVEILLGGLELRKSSLNSLGGWSALAMRSAPVSLLLLPPSLSIRLVGRLRLLALVAALVVLAAAGLGLPAPFEQAFDEFHQLLREVLVRVRGTVVIRPL
jgi:hypothetical protein